MWSCSAALSEIDRLRFGAAIAKAFVRTCAEVDKARSRARSLGAELLIVRSPADAWGVAARWQEFGASLMDVMCLRSTIFRLSDS